MYGSGNSGRRTATMTITPRRWAGSAGCGANKPLARSTIHPNLLEGGTVANLASFSAMERCRSPRPIVQLAARMIPKRDAVRRTAAAALMGPNAIRLGFDVLDDGRQRDAPGLGYRPQPDRSLHGTALMPQLLDQGVKRVIRAAPRSCGSKLSNHTCKASAYSCRPTKPFCSRGPISTS
jgi:hypothetical protein